LPPSAPTVPRENGGLGFDHLFYRAAVNAHSSWAAASKIRDEARNHLNRFLVNFVVPQLGDSSVVLWLYAKKEFNLLCLLSGHALVLLSSIRQSLRVAFDFFQIGFPDGIH
jgi:hypothetical protein